MDALSRPSPSMPLVRNYDRPSVPPHPALPVAGADHRRRSNVTAGVGEQLRSPASLTMGASKPGESLPSSGSYGHDDGDDDERVGDGDGTTPVADGDDDERVGDGDGTAPVANQSPSQSGARVIDAMDDEKVANSYTAPDWCTFSL